MLGNPETGCQNTNNTHTACPKSLPCVIYTCLQHSPHTTCLVSCRYPMSLSCIQLHSHTHTPNPPQPPFIYPIHKCLLEPPHAHVTHIAQTTHVHMPCATHSLCHTVTLPYTHPLPPGNHRCGVPVAHQLNPADHFCGYKSDPKNSCEICYLKLEWNFCKCMCVQTPSASVQKKGVKIFYSLKSVLSVDNIVLDKHSLAFK